ncbi:MAG TPA: GDP-mannose 4,6-dehydratase [bacterium]|nr:GDP-mannose 4,6-dehydratase [bacterium]
MKTLVTGMGGFVGPHLARLIAGQGGEAVPFYFQERRVDLTDADTVGRAIKEIRPGRVYHLAALSSVGQSWQDPDAVFAVNVDGTRNLLQALSDHAPEARVLMASSGSVYGPAAEGRVFKEDDELNPQNPYARSKARAEEACAEFAKRGLDVRVVRPLGHTGPGQRPGFVVPDLASQVAAIALKKTEPLVRAGNLEVEREFADVRDVARAYEMVMEKGGAGPVFNLSINEPHSIREVALTLMAAAGVEAELISSAALVRKNDECSPRLDVSKISALGFRFEIPFQKTMAEVLDEWVQKLGGRP